MRLQLRLVEHGDVLGVLADVGEDVGRDGRLGGVRGEVGQLEEAEDAAPGDVALRPLVGAQVEEGPERQEPRVAVLHLIEVPHAPQDVRHALLLGVLGAHLVQGPQRPSGARPPS